jgi:hypothetical protein
VLERPRPLDLRWLWLVPPAVVTFSLPMLLCLRKVPVLDTKPKNAVLRSAVERESRLRRGNRLCGCEGLTAPRRYRLPVSRAFDWLDR